MGNIKGNASCHTSNDRFRAGWDRIFNKPAADDPWRREEWLRNLDASRDDDDREVSYEDILREIGE